MRIALLQLEPIHNDPVVSLSRGLKACEEARLAGADLALFPEMWNSGYFKPSEADLADPTWGGRAVPGDGRYVKSFQSLAKHLGMAIGLTLLEEWPGHPRNALVLIDSSGGIVLRYAKVHTCVFGMERQLTAGEEFPVAALRVADDVIRVGAMICYDREFPEPARLLMLDGAELILNPNAAPINAVREGQILTRATENMVAVAFCNYAGEKYRGGSQFADAMAYSREGEPLDPIAAKARGAEEQIVIADLDLMKLRAYREYETWGNAYRRPRLYGRLSDEAVHEPFIREDARR